MLIINKMSFLYVSYMFYIHVVDTIFLLSELRRRHTQQVVPPEDLFPFLLSFTCVTFFIHWPFSPAASSINLCWPCFVCSGLTYEIYSGGGPYTYIYCVVCYCVIAARICTKCCCVFAQNYTRWHLGIPNGLWALFTLVFFFQRLRKYTREYANKTVSS